MFLHSLETRLLNFLVNNLHVFLLGTWIRCGLSIMVLCVLIRVISSNKKHNPVEMNLKQLTSVEASFDKVVYLVEDMYKTLLPFG